VSACALAVVPITVVVLHAVCEAVDADLLDVHGTELHSVFHKFGSSCCLIGAIDTVSGIERERCFNRDTLIALQDALRAASISYSNQSSHGICSNIAHRINTRVLEHIFANESAVDFANNAD